MFPLNLMMISDFWVGYLLSDTISALTWHTMLAHGVILRS